MAADDDAAAWAPIEDAYHHLCGYTLGLRDAAFTHQHVVDAWAAQTAAATGKPIAITFALVGLYLRVEKGWTGRRVQLAHMQMGRQKQAWRPIVLPADRGLGGTDSGGVHVKADALRS